MWRSIWKFIKDSIEALVAEDQPRQLSFDFEKEKRRWDAYLHPPSNT